MPGSPPPPPGTFPRDHSRDPPGHIMGGSSPHAFPATVHVEGELRSFEAPAIRNGYMNSIRDAFEQTAQRYGGSAEVSFKTHTKGYTVAGDEPLLKVYRGVLPQRHA